MKRISTNTVFRDQYEKIKERAEKGNFSDSALVFVLEGGEKYANIVRNYLIQLVEYRSPSLDEDISAGGHREGNMDFYWDTAEIRAYDLVYQALTNEDRQKIETFYRKLGNYWKDSISRWTTTPNLIFPIHYHALVIGLCINDKELIEWGLYDTGGKFGPSRGGLFPVLDSMLRDGTIWDEATIYAAVNVLQPMLQLAILYKLCYNKDLFSYESPKGGSIKNLLDGYIALTYPLEKTGVGPGSFHVATYGDGSTESPYSEHHKTDSLYLINLPWVYGNDRYELTNVIEQAYYLTKDPKYAWFLSHSVEREPSFLYGEIIPYGSIEPPPAPSSIFPEAGIAMLRSDESPNYWTNGSIAVLQMMSRGYGHDHRDKMMIIMHAGGRLLYPDMNCIQYESPSINWTANTVAHNTLVVDCGKTANSPYTYRHEFNPEVKFLATAASCYPGVKQTRVLALTSEYLLDMFWANSDLLHTYDWVLHAIGKLHLEHPQLYRTSSKLIQDYWWIENEKSRETDQTWRADFVQQNGLAIRGMGRQTDEWFNDRSAVRVTMLGETGTVVYGAEGPIGGPPVDHIMNPEGNLPILLVRRNARQTVFTAVHEPYKLNKPYIDLVQKVSASKDAYIVEINTKNYTDIIAVTFDEQKDMPIHTLVDERDPNSVFVFRNYGYVREKIGPDGKRILVARGNWIGFRIRVPEISEQNALVMNDKHVEYQKDGDYILFGDISSAPKTKELVITEKDLPLELIAPTEPIRLATYDSRKVALKLRNCSQHAQSPRIRIRLPRGINVEPSDKSIVDYYEESEDWNIYTWALPMVATEQFIEINLCLITEGSVKEGFHPASFQVTSELMDSWTLPIALPVTVGAVLVEDNTFPTFGEYVIYAPKYILRVSKRYGTSRFLKDDNDRPRYEATFWDRRPTASTTRDALPRLSIGGKDVLAWGMPASFIWTNSVPASITVGTNEGRITWNFEDDAIKIEPVALWTTEAPHEFIFPGHNKFGWVAWGRKPKWVSIVSCDELGEIKVFSKPQSENQKILAAALMVPEYDEAICFAMDRPQMAKFDDTSIHIYVNPGEPIWFGLSRLCDFDNWWRSRAIQKSKLYHMLIQT